jgi:peptide/nickel transport system substrate-binding protein
MLAGCDFDVSLGGESLSERGVLGTSGGYRQVDTLVIGRATDATDLDPALPTDNESAEVIEQIFDTLIHFRPGTNMVEPGLAVSWTPEDSGRAWVFELRKGVRFHDGTPLDADAVVFSLERQRDTGHPYHRSDFTYWKSYFANVLAVEKVDQHRVRIRIERAYAPFLPNMAIFSVGIVSPAAVARYGDDFSRHPVGTGPFRFASWDKGRIVLERNDAYWDGTPRLRRLVFQTIPDHRQRLVALESGALDIAHGIRPEEIQFVELHPRLRLRFAKANSVTYLALNNAYPPFDDVRVRQAVNHAINKEPIVKVLWQGMAEVAESPLPRTQWGHYVVRDQPYRYDPARARELLDQARAEGSFDPRRVYTLHVPSTPRPYLPNPEKLGRAIQANLRDIGVHTELVIQPFADHVAALKWGEHDLGLYGWVGDNGDPDNFLYLLLDKDNTRLGQATNVAFFRDPEVSGLLSYAQETDSQVERAALYARAQAIIHEQAPWVPLAHSKLMLATRQDIQGIVMGPSGFIGYEKVYRAPSEAGAATGAAEHR